MRYEHPKADMHANGIYGGIGSCPAHEAWTPGGADQPAHGAPVPKVWRRLCLRRTQKRPMASDEGGLGGGVVALLFIAGFLVAIALAIAFELPLIGKSLV